MSRKASFAAVLSRLAHNGRLDRPEFSPFCVGFSMGQKIRTKTSSTDAFFASTAQKH
jgi:hypothetical protein